MGAGLGGLTAAIALRQRGFAVEVHEAATALGEVGAGLTLGRGAQSVFRALGLQAAVAARACPAGALPFVHYRTARLLMGGFDSGDGTPDDGVADIVRHIYRADLQAVLLAALADLEVTVATGHAPVGIDEGGDRVTARFADGSTAQGAALVGADGVRSAVRELLWPRDAPRFTDHVAYRFLVPAAEAAPFMGLGRSVIFMGPQRTFNRYTMCGGSVVNCAGIVETTAWAGEGWSIPATRDELLAAFAGWHPDVIGLIGCAASSIKWGLYDRAVLPRWSRGRVTLLGDAAHAMLPFLGMGAAMAIEDGWALAAAFSREAAVEDAFARYEAARGPRTALLHAKSIIQGKVTQSLDPDTFDGASAPVGDPAIMAYDPVAAGV
ncbi:FAD-dependent monooxygenase [Sandarakinorhabdus sp. DWP1-3-1]|uniref:FAD-dependent monooxygenase n=1 Tax=Sandarakinorhabdus sp. DWP1-3-1 TaxID=2804627 RepID=UPI003CF24478